MPVPGPSGLARAYEKASPLGGMAFSVGFGANADKAGLLQTLAGLVYLKEAMALASSS